jgi:hypothetical protein
MSKSDEYYSLLFKAKDLAYHRLLISVPMTGLVRAEWCIARWGQVIPCNWSHSDHVSWMNQYTPLGYAVAEARNLAVDKAVQRDFEWLLFIDHDVILPPDCFVKLNQYLLSGDYPVVSGLYYAKAHPPEPLIYRGRGNGYFKNWKMGDKVMVDGIPMGCTLINVKLLKAMWEDAPEYTVSGNQKIRKVFDTPYGCYQDPEKKTWDSFSGTEDLAWCNRVISGKYLAKAGWPKLAKEKYPFLMDTSIFCRHITNDGQIYPIGVG